MLNRSNRPFLICMENIYTIHTYFTFCTHRQKHDVYDPYTPTPTTLPLLAYSQHAVLLNDAEMSRKKVESEDQSQNPESVPVLAIDYAYVAHPTEGNTQRDTELGLLGILSYRLLVS